MVKVNVEIKGLNKFLKKVDKIANKGMQKEVSLWLEASGFQFLEEVQLMIKSMEVVDTRRLLNSFDKGGDGNVWETSSGGLKLTIGTNVSYARYVNDGHFTIDPSKGLDRRWVPGVWNGDRFIYTPGSSEGMLLKFQWVDGQPYWDNALIVFEKMFEKSFEKKLIEWSKRMGGR